MLQDVRLAIRLFRRSPGFASAVVLTFALGVGLTSLMFSIVDGVLLRPLPYREPSRLITVRSVPFSSIEQWKSQTHVVTDFAFYDFSLAPLVLSDDETVRLRRGAVSANLLSVLGVTPVLGRGFDRADGVSGAEPVAILTYGAWQEHFGKRASVIGEVAPFDPEPRRIVGVLPPDFMFPMRPVSVAGDVRVLTVLPNVSRPERTFGMIARLAGRATLQQARMEESLILRAPRPDERRVPEATTLTTAILGQHRFSLLLLFGAVGFLLLIACANVAQLFFARVVDARRLSADGNVVGRRIRHRNVDREIVGVVRDVRIFAVDIAADPQIYVPHTQNSFGPSQIVVRTASRLDTLAPLVRREIRALEPHAVVENLRPLSNHVAASIAHPRFRASTLGIFGASGLLLVAVGIGGVVSYTVSRRTREIGVRVALGAQWTDVVRTVGGTLLAAVIGGLILGFASALVLGRLAKSLLYGLEPTDPWTFAAVLVILTLTTLLAAALPIRRALRVDPVVALRAD